MRGRPTKFKKEILNDVKKLAQIFCSNDCDIAAFLNVPAETFSRWKKKHPELQQFIDAGKAHAKITLSTKLFNQAKDGNMTALIFVLTNKFSDEWADKRALVNNYNVNSFRANGNGHISEEDRKFIETSRAWLNQN